MKLVNILQAPLTNLLNQQAIDWRERQLTDYASHVLASEYHSLKISITNLSRQPINFLNLFNQNIDASRLDYTKNSVVF
jgi:hypothetical protein